MTVHSAGTGTGWNETLDVDQPHGLDYRELNDFRIGVRKRLSKEHVTPAGTTAGGEHLPGKCGVLLVCDDTEDFTAFVDATTAPLGSMAYCITHANMWCITATASGASPDFTVIKLGPLSFCLGDDFTWDGAHLFDASCDFSDVAATGDFTLKGKLEVDGTVNFNADVNFAADASFDGTVDFAADVAFVADVSIDGTLVMQDAVLSGDSTFTFDAIAGETGPTFNHLGDWSEKTKDGTSGHDTTYTARTDGVFVAYGSKTATALVIRFQTPAGTDRHVHTSGSGLAVSGMCPVKNGDTWALKSDVTAWSAGGKVYWIPFGDNT